MICVLRVNNGKYGNWTETDPANSTGCRHITGNFDTGFTPKVASLCQCEFTHRFVFLRQCSLRYGRMEARTYARYDPPTLTPI